MKFKDRMDTIRRAFEEFLALPSLIILGFLALAVGAYIFERSELTLYSPLRSFLVQRIFADSVATSDLLSTIAGSIITVTSITITLMLLILQQTASTMSTQVFDQFLRRRSNQVYFGFFIGLALYTLITLATVDEPFNPVFAAGLAYILTVITLYLLILLFYSTIHQMRPTVIIRAIHDHTLAARQHQRYLLSRTRRESEFEAKISHPVYSTDSGFVTKLHLHALAGIVDETERACEIVLKVSVGDFVTYRDIIAVINIDERNDVDVIEKRVREVIYLERSRNLDLDPAYGIAQLENIAWTATSTAKSNPTPGKYVIFSLRDLLARWAEEVTNEPGPEEKEAPLPIVYHDNLIDDLLGAFESLAVVASQTKEHQILTEILNSFSSQYHLIPEKWRAQVHNTVLRILPTFEQHILTRDLELAITKLIEAIHDSDQHVLEQQIIDRYVNMQRESMVTES